MDTVTDTHGAVRRPGPLWIGHTAVDGTPVVTVRGEIDHPVKNKLNQALLSYNGATPPRTVLDLSGVTFMSSSGINVLITAHKSLSDAYGWLRLAGPQTSVLPLIELVGLDQVIDCHPTVEQALTA
ncbi:STAS domain-containing protein [Streptomyces canus]|uniref:STAS domain-containing protein n=1 Tax=Streptomyces canus TaxID=58343 RepID=UPI0037145C0B